MTMIIRFFFYIYKTRMLGAHATYNFRADKTKAQLVGELRLNHTGDGCDHKN